MGCNRRGLTLIETAVAGGVVTLLGVVVSATLSHVAEDARSSKCRNNLKRVIRAVEMYAADYDGILPGPTHPAIKRGLHNVGGMNPEVDRLKSLAWLLRPYFPPVGDSATNPETPNPIVDEIMRCPTAGMFAPDEDFDYTGSCWQERPYNYACNTWGPIMPPGSAPSPSQTAWNSTDPPHYFGAWFFCDSSPDRPDVSWRPKKLASVRNPGGEWAVADAWYRHVAGGAPRPGQPPRREWLGTFAPHGGSYASPLPSAPYHRVAPRQARSHKNWDTPVLPGIDFDGETNQAYFDGHVAPFKGNWLELGDGGTVNPYWEDWGGTHPLNEPWYP